jgi:hypothetical protein
MSWRQEALSLHRNVEGAVYVGMAGRSIGARSVERVLYVKRSFSVFKRKGVWRTDGI